ncbi:MAG: hypothetical protein EBR17_01695 [Betaproteobacteria bacterium]|jgi:hypothetical protein|nr:DUF6172 family protein [Burkholderiales bacterium]NBX13855.1 hypothetical protein [Betaproteobacteria bacterium]NBX89118.1 hypothetical protein [Betaproteobacteria bacterium]
MKKTFKLQQEGRHPDRVLDAVKHEIRQYVRREGRKSRPAGVDYWDFDCKMGLTAEGAEILNFSAVMPWLDAAAKGGAISFYLEILAKPGVRLPRPISQEEAVPEQGLAPSEAVAK